MNEFEIIERYFKPKLQDNEQGLELGVGDDAAVINISQDEELVVSIDTLVEGVHFLKDTSPQDIANKSLLVNLSDIAAMGASPRWITLSLTLPAKNPDWLKKFPDSKIGFLIGHGEVLPSAGNKVVLSEKLDKWQIPIPEINFSWGENEKAMTKHMELTIKSAIQSSGGQELLLSELIKI